MITTWNGYATLDSREVRRAIDACGREWAAAHDDIGAAREAAIRVLAPVPEFARTAPILEALSAALSAGPLRDVWAIMTEEQHTSALNVALGGAVEAWDERRERGERL